MVGREFERTLMSLVIVIQTKELTMRDEIHRKQSIAQMRTSTLYDQNRRRSIRIMTYQKEPMTDKLFVVESFLEELDVYMKLKYQPIFIETEYEILIPVVKYYKQKEYELEQIEDPHNGLDSEIDESLHISDASESEESSIDGNSPDFVTRFYRRDFKAHPKSKPNKL